MGLKGDLTFGISESEKLFLNSDNILNNFPSGFCVYRVDKKEFNPVFRNEIYYQVMGYSDAHIKDIKQGQCAVGVHTEDLSCLKDKISGVLNSKEKLDYVFRAFHDKDNCYHYFRITGSVQPIDEEAVLFYVVYEDVTEEKKLKSDLHEANEKMQGIINTIPGGVVIYKVSDIFETVYFSDGIPKLTGYTVEEYEDMVKGDISDRIYYKDREKVLKTLRHTVNDSSVVDFEFRVLHKDMHIVWLRVNARCIGDDSGVPLIHCVLYNITDLKEAQMEMNHLINTSSGGVASYRVEGESFIPIFYSEGVAKLFGYNKKEFDNVFKGDIFNTIYEGDIKRVREAIFNAVYTGEVLSISCRIRIKSGNLIWIHLNGRRIGPLMENCKFYLSFSGVSDESRMYQEIANEVADAIYVIDRESYEILYFHESKEIFPNTEKCIGEKCYEALRGFKSPCSTCNLSKYGSNKGCEVISKWEGRDYKLYCRNTNWNGIPAFIQYVSDITDEVKIRQEKHRLEQYFKRLVENLPGGVVVVRLLKDGRYIPEFMSEGFADMMGTTLEASWEMYKQDALSGVHPEDVPRIKKQLDEAFTNPEYSYELTYRLKNGKGGYNWVRNALSMLPSENDELRQYCYLRDISDEKREQEEMRKKYQKLIMQHYHTTGPNVLAVGHCNIIKNRIIEVNDYTGLDFLKSFGNNRERFFLSFAELIVDDKEKQRFLDMFLNKSILEAYEKGEKERILNCLIKLPNEKTGRYVQCKVILVEEPDSKDVTGILTVKDVTEKIIYSQVLDRLSDTGYDYIIVLDLIKELYSVFTSAYSSCCIPKKGGIYSEWIEYILENYILPKDKETYKTKMQVSYIYEHLKENGSYSFDFSITDDDGNIRVKRMMIFDIDMRIGRVGLSRTDVTDTVREQQSLLNMLAYTFELAAFIDIGTKKMTMHTRQTVLEDLPAFIMDNYDDRIVNSLKPYDLEDQPLEYMYNKLKLDTMLEQLKKYPLGYDFVCAYKDEDEIKYKKINVLWGDRNCQTVCIVRADVTQVLIDELKNKKELEAALSSAKEANKAKSEFLSAMSHDIRTPMNAIMGMTALATARPNDSEYVSECLEKISLSSKHLLNLINDVLDMSKIEQSEIDLNREYISLEFLVEQVSTMVRPQAEKKNQEFIVDIENLSHKAFYGDELRLNQILINVLSNAVKFTYFKGCINFKVEELSSYEDHVKYLFTVKDTGIGMSKETLDSIFEPFSRGSHVSRIEGTGLGLSITKGLIEQMGGNISVESKEGIGSVFSIELEFEAAKTKKDDSDTKLLSVNSGNDTGFLKGRHFLIAEDNEINAEILKSLLEINGASSDVTCNGKEAKEKFAHCLPKTYDAILMDIQMPVMNGYEATRDIRKLAHEEALSIPIIAMTANAFAEDIKAAKDAGMDAHISKPIDTNIMITTLKEILS